jgi:hypothetical protein
MDDSLLRPDAPSFPAQPHITPQNPGTRAESGIITLNVGGRIFKTLRMTIKESEFLRDVKIKDWDNGRHILKDGSFFLDADPDIFAHLLRYMRRPEVFPLFWDPKSGFDYDLYHRLGREAVYFGIDELAKWILDKEYLNAVKTHRLTRWEGCPKNLPPTIINSNASEEIRWVTQLKKVYICPMNKSPHRDHSERCGRQCNNFRGEGKLQYDEESLMDLVSVTNTIEFDEKVCSIPS